MGNFTLNEASPGTRDKLRILIGDTNPDQPLFSDEELGVFLTRNSDNLDKSAADACRAVAFSSVKLALVVKLLDTSIDRSKIPQMYLNLAKEFQSRADLIDYKEPLEYIDSMNYRVDEYGVDTSEYVDEDELGTVG